MYLYYLQGPSLEHEPSRPAHDGVTHRPAHDGVTQWLRKMMLAKKTILDYKEVLRQEGSFNLPPFI